MNKPKCETCAYFETAEDVKNRSKNISTTMISSLCRRHCMAVAKDPSAWCGEHHQFEEYLDWLWTEGQNETI